MCLAVPNALAQFLTEDEFARTCQEDGQYSRRLPLERQRARIPSQLEAFDLKVKDPKPVNHGARKCLRVTPERSVCQTA